MIHPVSGSATAVRIINNSAHVRFIFPQNVNSTVFFSVYCITNSGIRRWNRRPADSRSVRPGLRGAPKLIQSYCFKEQFWSIIHKKSGCGCFSASKLTHNYISSKTYLKVRPKWRPTHESRDFELNLETNCHIFKF